MKIVKNITTLMLISLATAGSAFATEYEAGDDAFESKLCVTAATNSKSRLDSRIDHYVTGRILNKKYAIVANEVLCNGTSIAQFAAMAGNDEVAQKLASYQKTKVMIRDIARQDNTFHDNDNDDAAHGNVIIIKG